MMEAKFLLICCLLGLSNADVRDAIGGVGVNVNYGGLHPPLSHDAGLQIHGALTGSGTLGHHSGTSSEGDMHSSGGERGGANNVFFHAKIGGISPNRGGAISTHDVSSLSGKGREAGTFGSTAHQTGSVNPSSNGVTVRDERIQDLIGTLPCCGENKNIAPQSGGFVGTREQSSPVNAGGHSSGDANLIGNLGSSNIGSNSEGQAEVSGGSHSTETSRNVDNMTDRSGGFHNLIGTLDHSNTGSNAGGHSAGFANLIGTITPSTTGSNTGGHSGGFGNLIGTLTPANTGGVSHRYSSELSGFQSVKTTGNAGGMTAGHSVGFGNLIGTLTPSHTGSNTGGQSPGFANLIGTITPSNTGATTGHSEGFGNLIGTLTPTNTEGVSQRYSSELSGFHSVKATGNVGGMTASHPAGFGNLIGTIKPGEISSNFGHSVGFGHLPNNAGATGSITAEGFSEMQVPMTLIQGVDLAGLKPETQPALSVSRVPTHPVNHAGVSSLEYKVPESAQRQVFGHQVSVPAVSTFSGNNGGSVSSHGQIGTFPTITMVDVVKSVEVPNFQSPQVFGVSASHKNIPSAGLAHSHGLGVMPVRYNYPSLHINYHTPSVQPAPLHTNFNGYHGSVSSGSAGSYTGSVAGQHRSYQRPTSFGYSGEHYNVHGTHSTSHANSHTGHRDEEFEGY